MEQSLSLAEVRDLLEKEKEIRGDLTSEQNFAYQHAKTFSRLDTKRSRGLVEELLKIEFISESNACKIADLLPKHPDDVRAIFAKERFVPGKEEIERILQIVEKYL